MARFLLVLILTIVLMTLAGAAQIKQIHHGSVHGPSGRFEMTKNQASPPVDLSLPPIFLREATPIHEAPQELEPVGLYRR